MGSKGRLEFEPQLIERIAGPQRRRRKRLSWTLVLLMLGGLTAAGFAMSGAISAATALLALGEPGIERMGTTLLAALSADDAGGALDVLPVGPGNASALAQEEQRVFKEGSKPAALRTKSDWLRLLAIVREDLSAQGVSWQEAAPVAFGGARGQLFDEALMREPVRVVNGDIYFQSQGAVFAIEVTAWDCGGECIIVDIWSWRAVEVAPEGVHAHARRAFMQFQRELGASGGAAAIREARFVFVPL